MDHLLLLLILLWSSGLQTEGKKNPLEVRLVGGDRHCAGTLEVKHLGEWRPAVDSFSETGWTEDEVPALCRELDCGPNLSVEWGRKSVDRSVWEMSYIMFSYNIDPMNYIESGSSSFFVNLTCSEFRLVGGDRDCAGTLELKHLGEWRPVVFRLVEGDGHCAGRLELKHQGKWRPVDCPESVCNTKFLSSFLNLTCTDSVRLVEGTSLCSGRLEVKSDQSTQTWSSVCEQDFDQQDAEVVCRELGCGAPSVLQGALYGELEAPTWTKEFQCGGHESALLDCRSSDRNTCSSGTAVGLTCSEPVRLVGGASRCSGTLEVKHLGDWRPVGDYDPYWTLKDSSFICKNLDCGSAVAKGQRQLSDLRPVWMIRFKECVLSESSLRECLMTNSSSSVMDLNCTGKPITDIISDVICS
ncbi:scavenger receptor cysteine-rich type 1 protein M130-like [Etheostoma spectabile]|uniref:scavenger receptor cysteine-rich type 1 protein M130-like n=1 Tax=Etheostoma spectabile TaxID=54343 RepID=UPI0013AED83E|nr:scavenger receptor cysteine-rich type 1 protein M130-like [Etheostoma spectabile]